MPDREGRLVAGRYRIRARLGSGGMGTVWRADDEFLERTVAIKEVTLLGGVDESAPAFQRTLREARTSARLRHPNIVTVHDVVLDEGRPWIVMELIDGPSLAEVVERDGPLADDRAADLATQLLAALGNIHEQGVLHRDVKPANVLLDGDRVVLTDFGIAAVEGGTALTATNQLIGSPQYLSPERINGRGAGQASDLWALGVTLYFAVTGASPFRREDAQAALAAVLTQEPPPVPGKLGPLVAGLLRKDPATRLTAADAVASLERDTETTRSVTREIPAHPAEQPATQPHALRGWRRLAVVLGVVVAFTAAVIIRVTWVEGDDGSGNNAGSGDSTTTRVTDRDSLVIGVLDDQPGVGFFDSVSDSFVGFDIEIAELVASKLGFAEDQITFTPIDPGERENAVVAGDVDMVVAAYEMTTEGMKQLSFAGPYMVNALNMLVRAGEPLDANSLGGHKVCATTGSYAASYIEAVGIEASNIMPGGRLLDCVDALSAGRVDAVFSDDIALTGYASSRSDLYDMLPFSTAPSVAYGICLASDEKPLRDEINGILTEALADGTWREIYDRTLGASGMAPITPTVAPS
jgi:eukaryotic-like serine/threonine-protein kinase